MVWIKRHLTDREVAQLKSQLAALPGVHLLTETARDYPEGELAAGVLGFTGIDNQGLAGVELTYNRVLIGKPGAIEEEYDARGQLVPLAEQRVVQPTPGHTLELTIDENIQWMAERAAVRAQLSTQAKWVTIVVMHPKTGGILALAQRPTFAPNDFRRYPPQTYRVIAVSDAIPPGSIFKPITLAAALQAGVTSPGATFWCPGYKTILGRRVNCWRPEGHGSETLADVVQNSCNVGFMELGLALGTERFYHWVQRFGLTRRTGIDLPGEALGLIPRSTRVTALDLAIMAFGQTLTATPMALLTAVSALANGGQWVAPHVGKAVLDERGQVIHTLNPRPARPVVQSGVAAMVQAMMTRVVSQGTGKLAQVPGYRVAGKTGTAQKVVQGRVEKGVYIASFVGFAPVPNPEVAILVSIDEPVGAFYGGQVAAPVFGRLMRDVLRYLNVPPTEPIRPPRAGVPAFVPDLVDLSPEQAIEDAAAMGFPVQFEGQGEVVVQQSVEYGGYRPVGTRLTLTLGPAPRIYLEWVAVPQFCGLTVSQAERLAFDLGINVRVMSPTSGRRVLRQSVPPGTEVKAGSVIGLWG
jgi:stage V sporulation protein D (sporulation-specific penicillin-binding protein)